MKEGSAAFVGANFAKPRAPNRGRPLHEYVTPGGRKVWDRWGTTPCYNSRGKMRPAPLHCHKPCRPALTKRKKAAGKKSLWMRALSEYNKSNGSWCVPTKDKIDNMYTAEYVAVLDIMERLKREDAQRDADAEDDVPLTELVTKTRYTQQDADADFERAMEESGEPSAFRLPRPREPKPKSTNKVRLLNVMDVYKTKRDTINDRIQHIREYPRFASAPSALVGVIRPTPTRELTYS